MTSVVALEAAPSSRRILGALVAGYTALLPYQFEVGNGVNFAPSDCFMLLALLLAPGALRFRRGAFGMWHFAIAAVFAAGSVVAVLRFGGLTRYEFLNKDAGLLLPFFSYLAITSLVCEWNDIRRLLRVFTVTVVLQNLMSVGGFLLTYFTGVDNPFARYGGMRLSGMLLDPNAYGGLLVAAFVICEGSSLGEEPLFKRPVLWFFRLTLAMGILFSFSRSAWSGLGLALLLFAALQTEAAVRLVLGVASGACGVFLLLGHRFVPIFEVMASRPKQVQGRFDLIHDAFDAFSSHPLTGGGIGSFRLSEGEIAHNSAMWFLADFGIVGLTVLLGFVGWFFVRSWRAYRTAPGSDRPLVLALLLGHTAMFGLAMGIEAFYQRHWWLVMGLIGASYSLATRGRSVPQVGQALPPAQDPLESGSAA